MKDPGSLKSDITYLRCLSQALLDGITSVPGRKSTPMLTTAVWTPMAVGAALGVLSATVGRRHRSGYRMAVSGLVGSAVGFGAGVAWTSRALTGAVARSTIQKVNSVRDARWLEKNPIAYA